MFGAMIGDIAGSPYKIKKYNVHTKDFQFLTEYSYYTDATVMTVAVAAAIMSTGNKYDENELENALIHHMKRLGQAHPDVGYSRKFRQWLFSDDPRPYHSRDNRAAMRVSVIGWLYDDLDDVRRIARLSARVTHDHTEGILSAEAAAGAVFLARKSHDKQTVREYIEMTLGYDLSRTCADIRSEDKHSVNCRSTIAEAITAFLVGESFEDVIRTAISLGGDSSAVAAIAGSIAEAHYNTIDPDWYKVPFHYMDPDADADLEEVMYSFCTHYVKQPDPNIDMLHEACVFAAEKCGGHKLTGTDIKLIVHSMEVLQLLTYMNAGDELKQAGVLCAASAGAMDEIRQKFGDRVARILSIAAQRECEKWKDHMIRLTEDLEKADRDTRLLVMAERLATLRALLSFQQKTGKKLWKYFDDSESLISLCESQVQDALYDMQYDDNINVRIIYWQLVDIYKDLFVTIYADMDRHRIFHDPLNETASVFYPEDRSWNTYRYEIPKSAVKLPRLKAEKLENLWSIQFYDDIMEKDEGISSAVTDHAVDPSDEKAAEIIELLIKKVHENGHLLMTKSESMDIAVKEIQKHSPSLRSLDLSHTLIIFSDYTALHRGPDIDTETVPAKNVFETVINHPEYNNILLNGFTVGFLIGKDDALNILENDPV